MPFIPQPFRALVFLRYGITGDYHSIANTAGNFPKIKIGARGTCDPTFIRETVTGAGGDCSFSLLVSNFDTFSRAQFFALARGDIHRRVSDFLVQRCKTLVPIWVCARARRRRGLSTIYFFIIVIVYRARARRAGPRFPRCLAYGSMSSPTVYMYTVIPCVVQETLISHLYLHIVHTIWPYSRNIMDFSIKPRCEVTHVRSYPFTSLTSLILLFIDWLLL